jgi:hypothetical protein
MKTKTQKNQMKGTREQIRTVEQTAPVAQQPQTPDRQPLPKIDFARRRLNRALSTERVLALLQKEAPRFFEIAEVVGKWVWVQFTDKQPREITSHLAELGFHWNNKRRAWQHPCGQITPGTESDPHEKYPHYFPSDMKQAA